MVKFVEDPDTAAEVFAFAAHNGRESPAPIGRAVAGLTPRFADATPH